VGTLLESCPRIIRLMPNRVFEKTIYFFFTNAYVLSQVNIKMYLSTVAITLIYDEVVFTLFGADFSFLAYYFDCFFVSEVK
jgi:hypothetical protein